MTKDSFLIRAKDITLIVTILGLLGFMGNIYKKTYRWDEAAEKIDANEKVQHNQETDLAVIKAQLSVISSNVDSLGVKIDRLRREN